MADDQNGPPNGKGSTPPNGSNGASTRSLASLRTINDLPFDVYEGIFAAWMAGERSTQVLSERFDIKPDALRVLISRGSARRGWRSLRDRELIVQSEQKAQRDKAAAEQAFDEGRELVKAKKDFLRIASAALGVSARAMSKVNAELETATAKRMRWFNVGGHLVCKELPPDLNRLCESMSKLADAIERIASAQQMVFASESTGKGKDPSTGWAALTAEQLRYIAETGKLPEGVTDSMLSASLASGSN